MIQVIRLSRINDLSKYTFKYTIESIMYGCITNITMICKRFQSRRRLTE